MLLRSLDRVATQKSTPLDCDVLSTYLLFSPQSYFKGDNTKLLNWMKRKKWTN